MSLPAAPRPMHALQHAGGIGQRIGAFDHRLDLAGHVPADQLLHVRRHRPPAPCAMNAPQNTPTTAKPLTSDRLTGNFGIVARGEADDQQPAVPGHRARQRIERLAADRIEGDVDALAAGRLLQRVLEILVAEHDVGAGVAWRLRAFRSDEATRDDLRAHRLADLHRGEAGRAGRAQHAQRLAGLQLRRAASAHGARCRSRRAARRRRPSADPSGSFIRRLSGAPTFSA